MSEVNSIVGTVGTWVASFVVLLITYFVAYKLRYITTPSDQVRNELMKGLKEMLASIRTADQATLHAIQGVEQIAIQIKNKSGTVSVPALK